MKKSIITLTVALFIGFFTFGQVTKKYSREENWGITASFGSINFDNTNSVNVQDNINVVVSLEVTKKFRNNMFASIGTTFSFLNEGGDRGKLWENPVDYLSIDANLGYRFINRNYPKPFVVPYIAVGTSYITKVNTIADAKSSFSTNITGGLIFWLNHSNFGLTLKDTYKFVDSNSMVSHNQIMVGLAYKFIKK
ncbi:MAG: hypothetical protein ACWIPJ_00865 [Polaribacter sp.]